jgi:anti-sigma B factor antagonist
MRIDGHRRGGVTVVALDGEFDIFTVTPIAEKIDRFIEDGARRMVFDLSALKFISSGGLGYFIQTAKRLRALGGDLVLARPPESFGWVIQTLGIDRVIKVFPDEAEAVAHLDAAPDAEGAAPSAH